jgi:hypothetical protein
MLPKFDGAKTVFLHIIPSFVFQKCGQNYPIPITNWMKVIYILYALISEYDLNSEIIYAISIIYIYIVYSFYPRVTLVLMMFFVLLLFIIAYEERLYADLLRYIIVVGSSRYTHDNMS